LLPYPRVQNELKGPIRSTLKIYLIGICSWVSYEP
jgi:hypothetical protein